MHGIETECLYRVHFLVELLRDQPDLERDDHAHQEADKQHDRNRVSPGFGGNAHHLAPANPTTMADCVPERAGALAQKTGNRFHVRNFLRGSPPDVLEDSDLWTPRRRLREVLWIKRLHERSEVGGEIPHLD